MTPSDAALVLAVAVTLDPRLKPVDVDDAKMRAQAWAAVLDADMPAPFARDAVTRHYADLDRVIMPADVNRAWRTVRKQRMEEAERARALAERQQAELTAVPMPAEVRHQIRRMIERTSREE